MPGLFACPESNNPNLVSFSVVQVAATIIAVTAIVTALLPFLRFSLSAVRQRFAKS